MTLCWSCTRQIINRFLGAVIFGLCGKFVFVNPCGFVDRFPLNWTCLSSSCLAYWVFGPQPDGQRRIRWSAVCFLDLQVPLLPPLFTDKRPPPSSSGFPSTRRSVLIFRHYGYYYYYLDIILAIICGRGRGKTCCLCSSSIILSSLPQEHWVILAPWWGRFNAWKCWNWNTGGG